MQSVALYFHPRRWPLPRLLQLLIGGGVLASGVIDVDNGMAFIGGLFMAFALFNVGCGACRGNNCEV